MSLLKFPPKYIRILFILTIGLIVASIPLAKRWMDADSQSQIYFTTKTIPKRKVGLILGCNFNVYCFNRINAAFQLYEAEKVEYILVSGDNHTYSYNESKNIKAELIKRGVPEDRIICDYAGFSTFDSIVRAKAVFGLDQFTIISQTFHLKRALFIANRKQINAIGFCAADVETSLKSPTLQREQFARVKTILDLYILHRKPRFLGEPIPIGVQTNSTRVLAK